MENIIYNTLQEWLDANPFYQWRAAQGVDDTPLPIRDAATRCGISYNSVWLWENGTFKPKYENIIKMAATMQYEGGADALYKVWQHWLDARPAETVAAV